jgi:hypothetical protein
MLLRPSLADGRLEVCYHLASQLIATGHTTTSLRRQPRSLPALLVAVPREDVKAWAHRLFAMPLRQLLPVGHPLARPLQDLASMDPLLHVEPMCVTPHQLVAPHHGLLRHLQWRLGPLHHDKRAHEVYNCGRRKRSCFFM